MSKNKDKEWLYLYRIADWSSLLALPAFSHPPPVPPEMQLYVVCRLFTHHELQGADKANLAEVPLTDPFCARRGNDVSGNLRGS